VELRLRGLRPLRNTNSFKKICDFFRGVKTIPVFKMAATKTDEKTPLLHEDDPKGWGYGRKFLEFCTGGYRGWRGVAGPIIAVLAICLVLLAFALGGSSIAKAVAMSKSSPAPSVVQPASTA
jgi:hypothetical protein